jgi:hypothetical protein
MLGPYEPIDFKRLIRWLEDCARGKRDDLPHPIQVMSAIDKVRQLDRWFQRPKEINDSFAVNREWKKLAGPLFGTEWMVPVMPWSIKDLANNMRYKLDPFIQDDQDRLLVYENQESILDLYEKYGSDTNIVLGVIDRLRREFKDE